MILNVDWKTEDARLSYVDAIGRKVPVIVGEGRMGARHQNVILGYEEDHFRHELLFLSMEIAVEYEDDESTEEKKIVIWHKHRIVDPTKPVDSLILNGTKIHAPVTLSLCPAEDWWVPTIQNDECECRVILQRKEAEQIAREAGLKIGDDHD